MAFVRVVLVLLREQLFLLEDLRLNFLELILLFNLRLGQSLCRLHHFGLLLLLFILDLFEGLFLALHDILLLLLVVFLELLQLIVILLLLKPPFLYDCLVLFVEHQEVLGLHGVELRDIRDGVLCHEFAFVLLRWSLEVVA